MQWDDAHLYWLASHAVGPAFHITHTIDSGRPVWLAAELPLVALVGRPPERRLSKVDDLVVPYTWFGGPSRKLKGRSWPDYAAVDARVGTPLGKHSQLWWEIAFRTYSEPRRVGILEQSLAVQWAF